MPAILRLSATRALYPIAPRFDISLAPVAVVERQARRSRSTGTQDVWGMLRGCSG